ncbi:DUF2590 family protein [Klebsiella pneumoniae]
MSKTLYVDLRITAGDFVLDSGSEPVRCNNRDSIAQDVVHMIIESALARQLVGERSPTLRYDIAQQLELLVETDDRLVPGTAQITEMKPGRYLISATTWDFGLIEKELTL